MKKPILVIMAAGMGSRFGGLKQIEPVSHEGEIILDFSLYDAVQAGFEKVVFIIKKENEEDFRKLIDDRAGKKIAVEYAFQELGDLPAGYSVPEGRKKPWGTAHAVLAARKCADAPMAVINADDYYGPEAFKHIYEFLTSVQEGSQVPSESTGSSGSTDSRGFTGSTPKYQYCMVGYQIENTLTENGYVSRGVCRTSSDGHLLQITEHTKIQWQGERIVYTEDDGSSWQELSPGTIVSMNFWGFTPSMIEEMEKRFPAFLDKALKENPQKGEYFLPEVVDALIQEGKAQVKVLTSTDKWYGVTYKEDKESVTAAIQAMKDSGKYPKYLWE